MTIAPACTTVKSLSDGVADDLLPHARVVERALHDHEAAEQVAGLRGDDRDRGQERVAQHVLEEHVRSPRPLR